MGFLNPRSTPSVISLGNAFSFRPQPSGLTAWYPLIHACRVGRRKSTTVAWPATYYLRTMLCRGNEGDQDRGSILKGCRGRADMRREIEQPLNQVTCERLFGASGREP